MTDVTTTRINKPVWVDLGTSDAAGARDFYARLFGWQVEVSDDPQYGGYGIAKVNGRDAAGIGPTQSPDQPTAWSLYIGTDDLEALADRVTQAGGNVVAPPFDVGDQGRMAVFQDSAGAFISAWQATTMRGFATHGPNAFGWAELNAQDIESAVRFYEQVFGWTTRRSGGDGAPPYIELQADGQSILGAQQTPGNVPPDVPAYWLVYFSVDGVDDTARRAEDAGGRQLVPPMDYPGGRFAVLADPQGATFAVFKSSSA